MSLTLAKRLIILACSMLGVAMSGFLSWRHYFAHTCFNGWISCGVGPKSILIFHQPTCVYGLAMFFAVLMTVLMSWYAKERRRHVALLFWIALVGVLFSGGLSFDEIFILKLNFTGLPACVVGFFLYVGIFTTTIMARRSPTPAPSATSTH